MNILILGDSFGIPTDEVEDHLVNNLEKAGFSIVNFSFWGGSNLQAINHALLFIKHIHIDFIIWFHTEPLREIIPIHVDTKKLFFDFKKNYNLHEVNLYLGEKIYKKFEQLRIKSKAKTIVIGGQSPILEIFSNISQADLIIKNWKSHILQTDISSSFVNPYFFDFINAKENTISNKEKVKILTDIKMIQNLMQKSKDFYDNLHPSNIPHIELSNLIINYINKSKEIIN